MCTKHFFKPLMTKIEPAYWSFRLPLEVIFIGLPLFFLSTKSFKLIMSTFSYNPFSVGILFKTRLTSDGRNLGLFEF